LTAASEKYDLPKKQLADWLKRGIIEGITTDRGEMVSQTAIENNLPKDKIIQLRYPELVGVPITLTEAQEKYNVNRATIFRWAKNNNYIRVLKNGYGMTLDEAEVAYCAEIYHRRIERGIGTHTPLLDKTGKEYQLKHVWLSKYRKKKKKLAI
ncbi:MAG: hypothetical protein DRJ03_14090, partial [Chloroflexi bacterium]